MTEERKQELRQLLEEAMDNLEIRPFGRDGSVVQPLDEYKRQLHKRWTFYSERPPRGTVEFLPYIANETTKSRLLDFIRAELAQFIHEEKIQSASYFLFLYKIVVNLNSNVIEKLQTPIERWIKSKVSINPNDKIIDSIIALEALYVTSKAKIGKQLRHRASWYLGENPAHQQELETELEAIYDYRSGIVHNRRIGDKIQVGNQSIPVSDLVPRVEDLCRQSIINIMEDGAFPNWNTLRQDTKARWASS